MATYIDKRCAVAAGEGRREGVEAKPRNKTELDSLTKIRLPDTHTHTLTIKTKSLGSSSLRTHARVYVFPNCHCSALYISICTHDTAIHKCYNLRWAP